MAMQTVLRHESSPYERAHEAIRRAQGIADAMTELGLDRWDERKKPPATIEAKLVARNAETISALLEGARGALNELGVQGQS